MMIVSRAVPWCGEIDVISDTRHVKNDTWKSLESASVHSVTGMTAHPSTDLFLLPVAAINYTNICLHNLECHISEGMSI